MFSGLTITPTITLDPLDASLSFRFEAGARKEDIDSTLERLFELPAQLAAGRKQRAAVIIHEFQGFSISTRGCCR